jgi:hypothetical protein
MRHAAARLRRQHGTYRAKQKHKQEVFFLSRVHFKTIDVRNSAAMVDAATSFTVGVQVLLSRWRFARLLGQSPCEGLRAAACCVFGRLRTTR